MKSEYYCKKCDVRFAESKIPNLNKLHWCGELLKLLGYESADEEEEES